MNRRRVYFLKPIGMDGPIKIGCSIAPDGRRRTLETWCPFPLEVVAELEGDFGLELRFHTKFIDSHQGREWFKATPELLATIEAIQAGRFDIDTLPEKETRARFRTKRDRSYITPAWRYRASVCARFRGRLSTWPWWNEEFKQIVPEGCKDLRPYREQIEALLERLCAERKRA